MSFERTNRVMMRGNFVVALLGCFGAAFYGNPLFLLIGIQGAMTSLWLWCLICTKDGKVVDDPS